MTRNFASAHDRAISAQFTAQASGFAAGKELHADEVLALIVDAASPGPDDCAIDLACGPGSVACALAERAKRVVGLDVTPAMLEQARTLAENSCLQNVEWRQGDLYSTGFADAAFDVVTCRFAFHHLEDPRKAFFEMARLAAPGGRIVLCDGVASDTPEKARAFNAMERQRDPSTVAFRTLDDLHSLFVGAGLGEPQTKLFQVVYLAADLVGRSFPADGDRAGLLALIEESVEGDVLGMNARRTAQGVMISYNSVVLSAIKAG
ncbi:class I SAM-dependent methyltransferase [Methylocystis hirsuta]|uniref:Class I SAM-dependent methyltransferase n=1 Tax=Methylocystis hirsuta TaxID=369798 RepID=A0A3M9XMA6_9HYPH|nr:class I SAM-dependent methyltransferase [Methylocystis hirsuta]RNJ48842.1 class I SAM-dependent methyltransferase [Methylocystis hirsuta]